ncbi:helix-turn-helix domain-containing protein [Ensifer sp. ENS04]|uniref:YdaS family helix-turn-helix protein n=1 Tax=Ensifer sp. ENS04 TaxID=2769281 RepID=UPI001786FBA5|nr:YdaS family helix-turn-helix protein [Ensifer sp. ENS04]MBD9539950.1 helix-turn-helix domain-containing protein [Ensifer sp. ENS04]
MEVLVNYFKANRGAQKRLADHLGKWPSTISQWKQVPVEHLAKVEAFTGIPREQLLPVAFEKAPAKASRRKRRGRIEVRAQ